MDKVVQYIIIAVIVLLMVGMFIMVTFRNKKETQKMQEQTNSLKIGDRVLTTSGVYGKIVELKFDDTQKLVVIETGSGKYTSYLTIDAYAIYTILDASNKPITLDEKKKETEAISVESSSVSEDIVSADKTKKKK